MVKRLEMNHKGLPEFDENGTWVFFTDYQALQQKLDAMAVENAALKKSLKGTVEWCYSDDLPETPATEAYLNSVRADGLKMAIDHMNNQTSDDCADVTVLPVIEMYKKLLSGTHDTADKAGAK